MKKKKTQLNAIETLNRCSNKKAQGHREERAKTLWTTQKKL